MYIFWKVLYSVQWHKPNWYWFWDQFTFNQKVREYSIFLSLLNLIVGFWCSSFCNGFIIPNSFFVIYLPTIRFIEVLRLWSLSCQSWNKSHFHSLNHEYNFYNWLPLDKNLVKCVNIFCIVPIDTTSFPRKLKLVYIVKHFRYRTYMMHYSHLLSFWHWLKPKLSISRKEAR